MLTLIPARLLVVRLIVVGLAATILLAASSDPAPGHPQYADGNKLLRPDEYREWIFLSSGLGISYSTQPGHEMFTNVFVPQLAYQEFLKSGNGPKRNFVVEDRGSSSKGSINKFGHFQADVMGLGVEVKDERFRQMGLFQF